MKDSHSDTDLSFDDESGQVQSGPQPSRGLSGLPPPAASTAASAAASSTAPTPTTAAPLTMASQWPAQPAMSQPPVWPPPASSGLFGSQPQPGSLQPASQTTPVQVSASTQPSVFSQTPPAQWSGLGPQSSQPPAASTPVSLRQMSLPAAAGSQTQPGTNQWQQPPPGPGQPTPAGQQPQQGPLQLPPDSPAVQAAQMTQELMAAGFSREEASSHSLSWLAGLQRGQVAQPQSQFPAEVSTLLSQQQQSIQTLAAAQASRAQADIEANTDALSHREPDMSLPANKALGQFQVEDNSTDVFAWNLRLAFKAPNSAPSAYWSQLPGNGAQKTEPRRATSLVFTHLMGNDQINPSVILMAHDRGNPLCYQVNNFNYGWVLSNHLCLVFSVLSVKERTISRGDTNCRELWHSPQREALGQLRQVSRPGVGKSTRVNSLISRQWEDTDNSHELVDSVYNYVAVVHHLRCWSPEGYALLRAFHAVRWFFNAFSSHKDQVRVLKEALKNFFHATAQRGAAGTAPLDFKEIMEILLDVAGKEGATESLIKMGSCYSAQKRAPEAAQSSQLKDLTDWMNSCKSGGGQPSTRNSRKRQHRKGGGGADPAPKAPRGGGGGGGRGGGGRGRGNGGGGGQGLPNHLVDKLSSTCNAW